MELIKLFLNKYYWGLLMVKVQPNTSFVFKTFMYYLQNGAVLIMGYLKILWATSIFHHVALLDTMCLSLISTPESIRKKIQEKFENFRLRFVVPAAG